MKILVVTSSKAVTNIFRPEGEMYINFKKMGHDVTVLTQPDTEYAEKFRQSGIKVIGIKIKNKISLSMIRLIRQELAAQDYDVIYATHSRTIPSTAFAAIGFNAKLVTYRGTTGGLYRHDPTAYLTHLHPRVNAIACVSDEVAQDVSAQVSRDKVVTRIYKGHELAWYQAQPTDLVALGVPQEAFVIACVANSRPSKGVKILLESFERLADRHNIHLLLVGAGMEEVCVDISTLSKERVHVLGYRNDAPNIIAAADVLVQPSISGEGLPRTVMEALSYGTAVIATTAGGSKEIIENNVSGFIVPTSDPASITDKLMVLYHDRVLLSKMGETGRNLIKNKVNCSLSSEQYLNFFASMVNKNNDNLPR